MVQPLSYLADRLKIESVTWSVQRNDELSGSGDGRLWQAELAPPLWTAEIKLAADYAANAEGVAALIRSLRGAQDPFLLYNPMRRHPIADPFGTILGSASVSINSLGSSTNELSLKGLPAGYALTVGDKLQIMAPKTQFVEIVDTIAASGSGVTSVFRVFPALRAGTAVNMAVQLVNPACAMVISTGSHNPGTTTGNITTGASFKAIEKR
ncbi:hypothetical protein G6L09_08120 [Agrobacterium rhizogenes]|nr:hypothetical protein [Rhizobium rhizogenes]NTH70522.1 hypothetical protein [Rhizobium rhizogenes]